MLLLLVVLLLVVWAAGSLLAGGLCWAARAGDGIVVVDVPTARRPGTPATEARQPQAIGA